MKKIELEAVNRSATAKKTDKESLKNSGITRDVLVFRKDDIISIPEEVDVWIDSFVPKGTTESKQFYLITVEFNNSPYDATMASFRRSKMVIDEDLDKILNNSVNRTLHNLGDDEQRANYLAGKTLKVISVITCTDRFRDNHKINIPLFEII